MATPNQPARRTYKPKVHVILDLEALSLDSHAAIIHIAAIQQYGSTQNQVGNSFEVKIKPSCYVNLPQFTMEGATQDWHEAQNPGYLAQLEAEGVSLQEAMLALCDWMRQYSNEYELHLWTQGKDYDYPILGFAARECGVELPVKYRNVHCLRDLLFLNPASRLQKSASGEAAHTAMEDTKWAWRQFNKIIAGSNWLQRLLN